ncbi:hypothetical protein BGZ72_009936 [Mortierella alpina]|nr:hypothetical protein BGZ72_009936 [Mortierella alpina]
MLLRNLTVLQYRPSKSTVTLDPNCHITAMLLLLEASPALQILHLSSHVLRVNNLVLDLARIIRERGRRLKDLRIDGPKFCIHDEVFYPLLWSCAAVETLYMALGPYDSRATGYFVESLPYFKTLAREALSTTDIESHVAQSEAAAKTRFLQRSDRVEFAWKELGPGGWLDRPRFEIVHELLQMCPSLERMVFPKLFEQDVITHLDPVVANVMPQLCHLDLTLIDDQPVRLCHLVQTCKDLITLHLGGLRFNVSPLMGALLSGHGHSLQSLHIEGSAGLSSQQLNLILSSCPRLKSLYAWASVRAPRCFTVMISPILNTKHMAMIPGKPGWICRDLETLHLCYDSHDMSIGIPKVLWKQIGQLSKLKDLRLDRRNFYPAPPVYEKESVRQAVTSWMALSDLRRLELRGLKANMDAEWIGQVRKQWVDLVWV